MLRTAVVALAMAGVATTGHAARQVEAGKIHKYPPPDPAYRFQPLVFETFGHWGAHAVQVVKACAVLASQRSISQKDTDAFQRAMWRKLSIAIQKMNWILCENCRLMSDTPH